MPSKFSFTLIRYNPRRKARGAEAAELEVLQNGTVIDRLWMSLKNIKDNLKSFPEDEGLLAALAAYKNNEEIR